MNLFSRLPARLAGQGMRSVIAALSLAFTLYPNGTAAQADNENVARARRHWERAIAAVDRGDVAMGLREFEQSYEASARPLTLYNIALLLETAGRLGEALEAADQIRTSSLRPEAQRRLRTLRRREAEVARLDLQLSPPGGTLRVDGHVRRWPHGRNRVLWIRPGEHTVTLTEGSARGELRFVFRAGERVPHVLTATPNETSAPNASVTPQTDPSSANQNDPPALDDSTQRDSTQRDSTQRDPPPSNSASVPTESATSLSDLPVARIVVARSLVTSVQQHARLITETGTGLSVGRYVLTSSQLVADALGVGVAYRGERELRPAQVAWHSEERGLAILWVAQADSKALPQSRLVAPPATAADAHVLTYDQRGEPILARVGIQPEVGGGWRVTQLRPLPITLGAVAVIAGDVSGFVGSTRDSRNLPLATAHALPDLATLRYAPRTEIALSPEGDVPQGPHVVPGLRVAARWNAIVEQSQHTAMTMAERRTLGQEALAMPDRIESLDAPWQRQPFYQELPRLAERTAHRLCQGPCAEAEPDDEPLCDDDACRQLNGGFFVGLGPHLILKTRNEDLHFMAGLELGYDGLRLQLGVVGLGLRFAAHLKAGSYRDSSTVGVEVDVGGFVAVGTTAPVFLELSYLPGFITAESRSLWSWRGYRMALGVRLQRFSLYLSWTERGRDADDTMRLLGAGFRINF